MSLLCLERKNKDPLTQKIFLHTSERRSLDTSAFCHEAGVFLCSSFSFPSSFVLTVLFSGSCPAPNAPTCQHSTHFSTRRLYLLVEAQNKVEKLSAERMFFTRGAGLGIQSFQVFDHIHNKTAWSYNEP